MRSEENLPDMSMAAGNLGESVITGKWAYQRTNEGVLKHGLLASESGDMDLWIEHAIESDVDSDWHEVSALIYFSSHPSGSEGMMGSVAVRGEGFYAHRSGFLCLVGCMDEQNSMAYSSNSVVNQEGMEKDGWKGKLKCHTRITMRLRAVESGDGQEKAEAKGVMESLKRPGEDRFFSPLVIQAATSSKEAQISWFHYEMLVEAAVYAVQALCILHQILHTRRDPEGHYVSQTMVTVQIFVFIFYWARAIYDPIRDLDATTLSYLMSDLASVPRYLEFLISLLFVLLAAAIASRRRKLARHRTSPISPSTSGSSLSSASAPKGPEWATLLGWGGPAARQVGAAELRLGLVFWPAFAFASLVMWNSYEFDSFLRECCFLFLLPQIAANYLWDLSPASVRAVSVVFAVGTTAAQMAWLTYEVIRPRLMGFDAFFAFPHAWYWTSVALMALQLAAFVGQRVKGGRFGYGQGGAGAEKASSELTML